MNNFICFQTTLFKNIKLFNWIDGVKAINQFFKLSGTLVFNFVAAFSHCCEMQVDCKSVFESSI